MLAEAETWDNGKGIRETTAADLPLGIDHFRYFAGVIRAEEGSVSEISNNVNFQTTGQWVLLHKLFLGIFLFLWLLGN